MFSQSERHSDFPGGHRLATTRNTRHGVLIMMYTKEEIGEFRRTWIEWMQGEGRRKNHGALEREAHDGLENPRCCLGQDCFALGADVGGIEMNDKVIYENKVDYLPSLIAEKLNITTTVRLKRRSPLTSKGHYTLAEINDDKNLDYSLAWRRWQD